MMEPEKPELFGYYFQIPIKAEVKKVQLSMLSSSVQEKIRQLGGRTKASYVVVVSPITIQKLPKSHKSRKTAAERSPVIMSGTRQSSNGRSMGKADKKTKKDLGTYLVPVKCSKDIALTILQLAKTSKEEKTSSESESSNFSNSLVLNHNLQMMEMKAATLYIYKNIMYLLPKGQEANKGDEENEADESEATESQAMARLRGNRKYKHNSLGCVALRNFSFLQQQDGRIVGGMTENSVTIVRSCHKERCDLPDEVKSTDAGPSSGSSTLKNLQMSFWEQSERQIKRKLPYLSNEEPFIKKTHQSDSDEKQDSIVAKNVLVRSPFQPYSSSPDAPSFSSEKTSPCENLIDSDAKQDSTVAKNVLDRSPLQIYLLSSDAPSPLSPQDSPTSFSHEETSPCGYVSDSGAKQDSTVAKNVLDCSPLKIHISSSDVPSPLIPQDSPTSFSHEETSPCGYMSFWEQSERQIKRKLPYLSNEEPFIKKTYQSDSDEKQNSIVAKNVLVRSPFQPLSSTSDAPSFSSGKTSPCENLIDSDAKQDSTVAKNVLARYPLQPHLSSSDASSPLSLQDSPASFSHEETSPCGYVSDSGAKQDSTVAKNVLAHYPLQPHLSSSDASSPLSLQDSPASFSREETSPCGYVSDSGAKQDSTVAKIVLDRSPLQPHLSSSDASSPLSLQDSPASFSHEKTSPCGYVSDSGVKQDSTVAKIVLDRSPLQIHLSSSDAPSPLSPQESPASFSHEETSPCGYVSDSGAKQDPTVANNVLAHYPLQPHLSSSDASSPLSLQDSPASFSHEETSPCGYVSDSGAKQDSTVAKNVLAHYPLQPHLSSSDASSPLSLQDSPASFSHEETSPCGYVSDSGAKQDSTVAKIVLDRSPLQPHLSSSDASSPLSLQDSPASFSHEKTSPCGYVSDSGVKQDSTVAKIVLDRSPLQIHLSSSDAPSPLSPQESPASFSHEETSPCGYVSDSGAKQDPTVANNVLAHYPLQPHLSSSDASSPLSLQDSPASFSHEETSPCGYVSDSGAKQDSTVAKNVLAHYPLQPHLSSSDASSPLSLQDSPTSFSHEETSPCRYVSDSGAKQDSTVAKNVLAHYPLQPHLSSSDASSPLSLQDSPASFSHEETSPCGYVSDSGAKQDSTVAKNVLAHYPLQPHLSSSDASSPLSLQDSPASFSHEKTSPCGYVSDSGVKQDSTVAKIVLDRSPLQIHLSSSDAPSPLSPQESPASFSHEETSPCGYVSDSGAKQDPTVANNVLAHYPLQPHLSSSDASSPLSLQDSPASFSHEETSPCGYVSDSGAKQDPTVANNVLARYPLQPHPSSSDVPSPLSPQESPASFSHEETSPCRYVSDSGAKQDSTVANNVLAHYSLQPHSSSSDAPSPLSPQESPASFSHEETSPCGYVSDSGAKQDSMVAKNVLGHFPLQTHPSSLDALSPLGPQESPPSFSPEKTPPSRKTTDLERLSSASSCLSCNIPHHAASTPLGHHSTCADNMSPPHFKAKSSLSSSEETSPASEPFLMVNHLRSDIDDTTRDEKRQRLLDRVIELKKKVEEMQQKSN